MAFSHTADDITLGRSEIYFAPFLAGTTNPQATFEYFGNTPGFSLSAAVTKLDHFSADRGLRVKDRSVLTEVNYTGTMESDNMNFGNLAKFFLGAVSTVTRTSATGTVETFTDVTIPGLLQLGVTPTNPQGDRNVTITSVAVGASTKVLGTDYEVDLAGGLVFIKPTGGSIVAGDDVVVTYNVASSTRTRVVSAGTEVKGALKMLSFNPEGSHKDILLPSVTISPNGELALKGEDWLTASFSLEVLAKNATTAAVYIDGRPA